MNIAQDCEQFKVTQGYTRLQKAIQGNSYNLQKRLLILTNQNLRNENPPQEQQQKQKQQQQSHS